MAGNERICESVDASDFSWCRRWTTSCASSPAVSDDDQCFGRPVFSSPCDRRNLRLSIAACAALRLLLPNFQTRDCLESVRHDKSGHLSVHGETEACDGRDSPAAAGEVPFAQLSLVRGLCVLAGEKYSFCPIDLRVAATPYASCRNISIDPAGT